MAQGYVGGLILTQNKHLVLTGDLRGALGDDPVLRPVMVHLQGQGVTGVHHDALDLKALTHNQRFIAAPGTVDAPVQGGLAAPFGFQSLHDGLDVLHLVPMRNQHGIGSFHDDQLVHTGCGEQPGLAAQIAVATVFDHHIANRDVAPIVALGHLPQRGPGAHVAPAAVEGDHRAAAGLFHDRVVDAVGGAVQKGLALRTQKIQVSAGVGHGGAAGLRNRRGVSPQFFEVSRRREQEHTAVPVVAALGQVGLCRRGIRLLDKAVQGKQALAGIRAQT